MNHRELNLGKINPKSVGSTKNGSQTSRVGLTWKLVNDANFGPNPDLLLTWGMESRNPGLSKPSRW